MEKKHLILLSAIIISFMSLTGCENKEKIRHDQCSKAILDFQQATIKGDLDIDAKSANSIIGKYSCTYKDVTQEEEQQRNEYLTSHPIKHKADPAAHFKNGKDWSKPWNDSSVHYDSSGKPVK